MWNHQVQPLRAEITAMELTSRRRSSPRIKNAHLSDAGAYNSLQNVQPRTPSTSFPIHNTQAASHVTLGADGIVNSAEKTVATVSSPQSIFCESSPKSLPESLHIVSGTYEEDIINEYNVLFSSPIAEKTCDENEYTKTPDDCMERSKIFSAKLRSKEEKSLPRRGKNSNGSLPISDVEDIIQTLKGSSKLILQKPALHQRKERLKQRDIHRRNEKLLSCCTGQESRQFTLSEVGTTNWQPEKTIITCSATKSPTPSHVNLVNGVRDNCRKEGTFMAYSPPVQTLDTHFPDATTTLSPRPSWASYSSTTVCRKR